MFNKVYTSNKRIAPLVLKQMNLKNYELHLLLNNYFIFPFHHGVFDTVRSNNSASGFSLVSRACRSFSQNNSVFSAARGQLRQVFFFNIFLMGWQGDSRQLGMSSRNTRISMSFCSSNRRKLKMEKKKLKCFMS